MSRDVFDDKTTRLQATEAHASGTGAEGRAKLLG